MSLESASSTTTPRSYPGRIAAPLRQEVIELLRSDIATGDFAPGDRLVERMLCERYEVSRTVMREALRHLEAQGLITIVLNRGPVVTELSASDAIELFELRAVLEGAQTELFASQASDDERDALRRAVEDIATAYATDDPRQWFAAKNGYYAALNAGAHNAAATTTLENLFARVQSLRKLSFQAKDRLAASLREVQEISELAVGGDSRSAGEAAREHVVNAGRAAGFEIRLSAISRVV